MFFFKVGKVHKMKKKWGRVQRKSNTTNNLSDTYEQANPLGLLGIDFIQFSSGDPKALADLFFAFGFSKIGKHSTKAIEYYRQEDIHFFLNQEPSGASHEFSKKHGPSISAMGWRFRYPEEAFKLAVQRGARPATGEFTIHGKKAVPAIFGIGDMIIYFLDVNQHSTYYRDFDFRIHPQSKIIQSKGFQAIDHLTNNVPQGQMQEWANYYKSIFNFTEVRYFDIRGTKTGLTSYALKSPCGSFCIPINEGTESKSQINEYLEEYKGPGIQHLAFLTEDILSSLDQLQNSKIQTLDIDDQYYADIFKKFPHVKENNERIRSHNVLIDGDENGYLLQIFTKNLIGPIFIEIIQRRNHFSFGEGNFGALFRSIEREQMKRGYLT